VRRREGHAPAVDLVADCEAFLLGLYAERLMALDAPVPVWAWTNLLAHGSAHQLRAEAVHVAKGVTRIDARHTDGWRAARAHSAAEVLRATGPQCPLAELQSSVLAPLELSIASCASAEHWDRRTWLEVVRSALREHHPVQRP
jgi:hypothetical protein